MQQLKDLVLVCRSNLLLLSLIALEVCIVSLLLENPPSRGAFPPAGWRCRKQGSSDKRRGTTLLSARFAGFFCA